MKVSSVVPPSPSVRGKIAAVVVAGLAVAVFVVTPTLRVQKWNPAALLRVGESPSAIRAYVEGQLGDIPLVSAAGHDGKYFFVQAGDPFLLTPDAYLDLIDRPSYRFQRMLYPALASLGGLMPAQGAVWGLIVVNLLAFGLGTWATARMAGLLGATVWAGLAFALNPGMLFELLIDGAGVLAWALGMVSLVLLERERPILAASVMASAVLAKETMILAVLGIALFHWKANRSASLRFAVFPVVAAVAWGGYVRWRAGVPIWTTESSELGVPFRGLVQAAREWFRTPDLNSVVGCVVLIVLGVAVFQIVTRQNRLSFAIVGFVALSIPMTKQVWLNYFDITRAVAPVFTVVVLATLSSSSANPDRGSRPELK